MHIMTDEAGMKGRVGYVAYFAGVCVTAVFLLIVFPQSVYAEKYEDAPIIKDQIPSKNWPLPKIYGNADSRYSIKYPNDWTVAKSNIGLLIMQGKENTPSYYSVVNVQAINSKQYGGKFGSVNEFMNSIKYQVNRHYPDAKFVGDGSVVMTQLNGHKAVGKYLIFTFQKNGILMKQWQIVIERYDESVFYTWAFTSPSIQYDRDVNVAKVMLDTWHIY